MSYIIDGVDGQDWQGQNILFEHTCEYLIPILRAMKDKKNAAKLLADRLEEAVEIQIGYMDLRDVAGDPVIGEVWIKAVDEAIAQIREEEGFRLKDDPIDFNRYLAKISELKKLVRTSNAN